MYIWHKEAKSTKFHVRDDAGGSYYLAEGSGTLFPKSEYEPCPPPSGWKNVTASCRLDEDRTAIAQINGGKTIAVTVPGFRFAETIMVPFNRLPLEYRPFAIFALEKVYRIEEERTIAP